MTSDLSATPPAGRTTPVRVAVIGGDGIGPEVTAEALKVLEAAAPVKIEETRYDLGAERYLATGEVLPDSVLDEIRGHDAILLGAVGGKPGDPALPPGILERGLLLRLRFELDHYVNLRPSRTYPGVPTPLADPGEVDFVVVREGTEGPYTGNGGSLRTGTPAEVATEVSLNTAYGVERVVRDAFARAARRPRRLLTLVHKTNVLVHAGGLWSRVVAEVGADFPEVTVDYLHVDAATIFADHPTPPRFDVIRHRQPVRRHPHRSGGGRDRRHRPRRLGQHQPRAHHPVDVRAGPRLRTRHRRTRRRRPHGRDPLGRSPARPPRPSATRPARIDEAVLADLTSRVRPGPLGVRVADRRRHHRPGGLTTAPSRRKEASESTPSRHKHSAKTR